MGQLASVIGLAPIRPGLKDRLRELLCIHGLLSLEMATGVGIAPTPPGLQPGVQTDYTIQWKWVRGGFGRSLWMPSRGLRLAA